jgi:phosphoribosylglycinamide formyltransferase-1
MKRRKVAILISGRGSNMAALIAAARDPNYPAEIALVISNRADAPGLDRADKAGVPTAVLDSKRFSSRRTFDDALDARLKGAGIEVVCLAGFMRLLTPEFVAAWHDRMINIHPSLLPLFPGLNTHASAISAGMKIHGCTVHFVRAAVDSGPIIVQAAVPVFLSDTPETLADRVLAAEHHIYPLALSLVAAERAVVVNERVVIADAPPEAIVQPLISPMFR